MTPREGPIAASARDQLDVFACTIDESAGQADDLEQEQRSAQLTELPGATFEDIFGDAA